MATNKERQRERIRACFIEVTKNLVKVDGISGITTKKIGDGAGFSYATIYNYFPNLNALLCEAVESINREMASTIVHDWGPRTKEPGLNYLMERIVVFTKLMLDHMAENINIYYPFLSTEMDFSYFRVRDGHTFVHPSYEILITEIMGHQKAMNLSDSDVKQLADVLTYVFHAKLHFFIRYKVPESRAILEEELNNELAFILKCNRGHDIE